MTYWVFWGNLKLLQKDFRVEMKTKKAIFFLFVFLSYVPVLAQVDTAWGRRYDGPGGRVDQARGLAIDDSGNVYVTGSSWGNGTRYDYATIKYSPNGDILWVERYNWFSDSDDHAIALQVDDGGNVYVTGSSGVYPNFDYATIKYSPSGETLWVRRYNGPANNSDVALALSLDDSGNVYVGGASIGSGTSYDFATIKYSPNGDTLWVRRYNGPGNSEDIAFALAVSRSGYVYVTGRRGFGPPYYDYATIKYGTNGDSLWVRFYNGPEGGIDQANSIAVDDSENVYVTGNTATIKYLPNGDTAWIRNYGDGHDLVVDRDGNVHVAGYISGDYITIKYASNGDTLWTKRYNGVIDSIGADVANGIAVDESGNVYVTGSSWGGVTYNDYATIKYSSNGDVSWVRRYDGPVNYSDEPLNLAIDEKGNVYVTGRSSGYATSTDYATIKYIQFDCVAKPGDANDDDIILLSDIVTIINFLFRGAPSPNPSCRADANADGNVSLPDIIYLINSIFKSGLAPQKSRECCL